MLATLKKIFRSDNTWQPVRRPYVISQAIEEEVYNKGYFIAGKLPETVLDELSNLYRSLHDINRPDGCMFSSHHSPDIEYRAKVDTGVRTSLLPILDSLFRDYKIAINSFLIKTSGEESAFAIHQDHTGMDETKFSGITVWIPLQDTNIQNGCLWTIPYSQKMFSPYRGTGIAEPYEAITPTLLQYMLPIELKRGDILLFDNRMVHCSLANRSGADRVAIVSNIMPINANLVTCYLKKESNQIQLVEHNMDYTQTYNSFYLGKKTPPEESRTIGYIPNIVKPMNEKDFLKQCAKYGLEKINHPYLLKASIKQVDINTPVM